jgi:monoamine oxidase
MISSGRTPAFNRLASTLSTALGSPGKPFTRRAFLSAPVLTPFAVRASSLDVGIVGAGLAGLSCGHELKKSGVNAALYEASSRPGGRCYSLRSVFPGQVAERGGELIDNLHKAMIAYAREFGLTLEDVGKQPGEVFYHFDGVRVPEATVVEEFRAFVPAMRKDLRTISAEPTADNHSSADVALDLMSLRQYLETRQAGRIAAKAIEEAYVAEYGREIDEQSCLNFLLFIHADRRSKFTPFGVYSDERYHIVEGNDAIATGLAGRLAGQMRYGKRLTAVAKLPTGRIRLTFSDRTTADHDAVVLTVPFTVLRSVDFRGIDLPAAKRYAIDKLGYGDNAKLMVGFEKPYWRDLGSNGASYSDLLNHQTTWETNPAKASGSSAVLTDYSGGERGRTIDRLGAQGAAQLFLSDVERVFPGAAVNVRKTGRGVLAHLEHWPSNPLSLGSYTCYLPGQFTTIAGNESKPAGNIFFAGEHTNSFYEWQGFMEGALLSGIAAAASVLRGK